MTRWVGGYGPRFSRDSIRRGFGSGSEGGLPSFINDLPISERTKQELWEYELQKMRERYRGRGPVSEIRRSGGRRIACGEGHIHTEDDDEDHACVWRKYQ